MFVEKKHTFVATKDMFCRVKHVFVASKLLSRQKMIFVAAPANDRLRAVSMI